LKPGSETAPFWYKEAILYELHVKAFNDANGDGIGDFRGLTEKLDYLSHLGVTALWLLPFYPSPMRDDGYDIANYRNVHPSYGTLRDFRRFLDEAHRRGLRIITELVINHTSDQHPWFQRARQARVDTSARNFYVWSETNKKYANTRIIFCDTEKSNWTWDAEAGAYYWHRFFSHQPDLNFDHPRVFAEITRIMRFWLDMGVDGLRLDAIPYLCERDGTNSENLPETHVVLKRLRAWLDEYYPDRMFLAEANQWPEDVRPYFGDGDACHMAFHFPLMPRIYMALAREDRYPITDILRQTPEIPESCQWAVFLRNHDELTLEMVGMRERDCLWKFYAEDPNARINLGIRRRLAPLLGGDRRKIELLTSLLLTMVGTPVLYYGDEIGMGDNIHLGDRNGVRTPMQWSSDRNGGFSRADPQQLYLPPIMDPIYGFSVLNVETQLRQPASLLNWMRRALMARKQHRAFARGETRLLYPRNRKILAYLRQCPDEAVLCIANLAASPQAAELDLSEFKGRVPVELFGRSAFPPIGDLPYFLTLPAHGFCGFLLAEEAEAPTWHESYVTPLPEFQTLVVQADWTVVVTGRSAEILATRVLPEYLDLQRWYAEKGREAVPTMVIFADRVHLTTDVGDTLVVFIDVTKIGNLPQRYTLPLAVAWEDDADDPLFRMQPNVLARVRRGANLGVLYDATVSQEFPRVILDAIGHDLEFSTAAKSWLTCRPTAAFDEYRNIVAGNCRRLGVEQSNSSLLVDDRVIIKVYRRLQAGIHPEIEIGRFLTDIAGFSNAPRLLGSVELLGGDGTVTAVALVQEFVRNQGDGWSFTLEHLDRVLDHLELLQPGDQQEEFDPHETYWSLIKVLARRIGELHVAFAADVDDPAFRPEPIAAADLAAWSKDLAKLAESARENLHRAASSGILGEGCSAQVARVLSSWGGIEHRCEISADAFTTARKTRIHGDLHLGQVVLVESDFCILDFEGEPLRSMEARRAKYSPLRDVAGMVRSFDYAGNAVLMRRGGAGSRGERGFDHRRAVAAWRSEATARFLRAYRKATRNCASVPQVGKAFSAALDCFVLEKALYEVCYEAANRPDWLAIPLAGISRLLGIERSP
jgi:maltose alpha-D-glucosyltransferase/alpha-amylase